jgi:serine/threonine protein kinase
MKYAQLSKIDKGGFSTVYRVRDGEGKMWAAKVLDGELSIIETTIMSLGIKGIAPLIDLYQNDEGKWVLIMPLYSMTLKEAIRRRIPAEKKVGIIKEISRIITELHFHGYSHSDLKLNNIMVDDDLNVYIIDFNISSKFNDINPKCISTSNFRQPEMKNLDITDESILVRSDSWSFGLICLLIYLNRDSWYSMGIVDGELPSYYRLIDFYTKSKDPIDYIMKTIAHRHYITDIDREIIQTFVEKNLNVYVHNREWFVLSLADVGSIIRPSKRVWGRRSECSPAIQAHRHILLRYVEKLKNIGYPIKSIMYGVNIFNNTIGQFVNDANFESMGIYYVISCLYSGAIYSNFYLYKLDKLSDIFHIKHDILLYIYVKLVNSLNGDFNFHDPMSIVENVEEGLSMVID